MDHEHKQHTSRSSSTLIELAVQFARDSCCRQPCAFSCFPCQYSMLSGHKVTAEPGCLLPKCAKMLPARTSPHATKAAFGNGTDFVPKNPLSDFKNSLPGALFPVQGHTPSGTFSTEILPKKIRAKLRAKIRAKLRDKIRDEIRAVLRGIPRSIIVGYLCGHRLSRCCNSYQF